MSDAIHEECGLALVRLLKPLSYYQEKYGTALWGFYKLFLLMEKQHNRGQDGAGVGTMKLGVKQGLPYMFRMRQSKSNPLDRLFNTLTGRYSELIDARKINPDNAESVKDCFEFGGEVLLGHLRYGTSGGYKLASCHPYFRKSNWATKNLMLAGNFTLTNTRELNERLIERGQHPIFDTDTQTLLEEIGYHLDKRHDGLRAKLKEEGHDGDTIAKRLATDLNPLEVLAKSANKWDGGYGLLGIIGNGDVFAIRDPKGIRPLHYFANDEVISFASERAPLMTVFNQSEKTVKAVVPGHAICIRADGTMVDERITHNVPCQLCSFERIYFSRGNDVEIYPQRKKLGALLVDKVLDKIDNNLEKTVFSFIPNTAEIAYYGMVNELRTRQAIKVKETVLEAHKNNTLDEQLLNDLYSVNRVRVEKVAHKDIKLRTFISQEKGRDRLASHIYDISYGSVNPGDNLVCIDDSIVRGTTLKQSIIKILARLQPSQIIICSTAPQIRYPDCYGIDMSELHKFIAFQAAVALLKEQGRDDLFAEVYENCVTQIKKPLSETIENCVDPIYSTFTAEQISHKISELVTPKIDDWNGEVHIVYQSIANLHKALGPGYGDWYFTGKYPTPGGYRVLANAYINYYENRSGRSY